MNLIKILIVEDDPLWSLQLERLVNELGYFEYSTDNSSQALKLLNDDTPHLALIDISISGSMDGIELSAHFQEKGVPFIIITSFTDTTTFERALKSKPFIFLTKPVNFKTLQSAIESALIDSPSQFKENQLLSTGRKIFIRTNDKLEIVDISTIQVIEVDRNYCNIFVEDNRKFAVKCSLKKVKQKLSVHTAAFIQVHRAFIVQQDCIKEVFITKGYLTVGNQKVPFGEKYKKQLLSRFDTL